MIELVERADGTWTWRWVGGDDVFWSGKSYSSAGEAEKSATRAYPGLDVRIAGQEDVPPEEARSLSSSDSPERISRRRRRPPQDRRPSRLVSLIVLLLAYKRSRSAARPRAGRR